MKKVISLLLAVILISGCNRPLNKSKVETAKTGIQNAKQPNPSSSPSPSPSLTPKPTTAPSSTETAMPLPSGQSALWWLPSPSQWSATTTTVVCIVTTIILTVIGISIYRYCGCCCFKKSNSDELGDDKTLETPKKETIESSDPLHSTTEKNASGSLSDEKKKKTAPPKKVKKSAEEEDKKDKKEKSDEKSDGE